MYHDVEKNSSIILPLTIVLLFDVNFSLINIRPRGVPKGEAVAAKHCLQFDSSSVAPLLASLYCWITSLKLSERNLMKLRITHHIM